ncbi:MAG TPA: nuclear transport factor 2 family protein [Chloroflexia bacterium]|nr:nuclear transport factor 2 family protein [Chloroflexia bacterium]
MSQMANRETELYLKKLSKEWTVAEQHSDTAFLERTLTDDFVGIGPLGFMLNKEAWLQRLSSGDLNYESVELDEEQVRIYTDAAVTICRLIQKGKYRDEDIQGQLRTSLIWVKQRENWLLAGLHFSSIMQKP